ncbi:hypothetical protein ACP4OV_002045 [Aristida adscensionis]
MELAMGAMGTLAPKLLQLLGDEYVVQKGLKPGVESLCRELEHAHAALEVVSRVPPDELMEQDKVWAQQLRELSYDMEDAIDAFMLRVAARQLQGPSDASILDKISNKISNKVATIKDSRQISGQIKDISNIAKELGELHARYKFSGGAPPAKNTGGVDPRLINLYKNEGDLVGVEKPRDKLIQMLTSPAHRDPKIVSIQGFGGLGKTTLAKLVYDRLKQQSFDCYAFVSVGRNVNVTNTLRDMLERLDEKYSKSVDLANWKVDRFYDKLRELLKDKRYIIVVDDIWEKETWKAIYNALPNNGRGSRVIITTRHCNFSKEAEVYELKPLSPVKSKELFYKRYFMGKENHPDNLLAKESFYKRFPVTNGNDQDKQLAEVCEKTIDKCDGVPLAIIAIASLLVDRPSLADWQKVYESIINGSEDKETQTRMILLYSYYDLPSYLKPCLLYLSMYPEDHLIKKTTLIWRWIAEDFVRTEREGELFEVGEKYFNELMNRSMIQPVQNNEDGTIEGCSVHDIVLDLIRDLSEQENFVTILGEKQWASSKSLTGMEQGGPRGPRKVRRLSIQRSLVEHIPQDIMATPKTVRSLSIISSKIEVMLHISSFKVCRVLVIEEDSDTPKLKLKQLDKLLHLRYLEIKGPIDGYELRYPKSLQTLILIKGSGVDELSPAVFELKQLKCLHVIGFLGLPAGKLVNLLCLEELKIKVMETDDLVAELGNLARLRMLYITFYSYLSKTSYMHLVQSLSNLHEIREIDVKYNWAVSKDNLTFCSDFKYPPRYMKHSSSPLFSNPSHFQDLRCISVFKEVVGAQDLENLALLPELLYLDLRCYSAHQGFIVVAGGFRNLRVCRVGTTFKFLEEAMPRLESLCVTAVMEYDVCEIFHSQGFEVFEQFPTPSFDFGLGNLGSLKEVTVTVNCKECFNEDVMEAETLVRRAVEDHPNHPALQLTRVQTKSMYCTMKLQPQKKVIRDLFLDPWGLGDFGEPSCSSEDHPDHPTIETTEVKRAPYSYFNGLKPHKVIHLLLGHLDAIWPKFDIVRFIRRYRWLEEITCEVDCKGISLSQVEEIEETVRRAVAVHRNRPDLVRINRIHEEKMASPSNKCNSELDDDHSAGTVSNDAEEQNMRSRVTEHSGTNS